MHYSSAVIRFLALVVVAVIVALVGPASALARAATTATVTVRTSPVLARTSPSYVSFAVDLDQVTGGMFWSQVPNARGNAPVAPYDFSRQRLRTLTRALAPAYLRISGTAANKTYYDMSGAPLATAPAPFTRILTKREWDAVNEFAGTLGLKVVLGVNAGPGPRDASGSWVPGNARALLQYTASRGYPLAAVEFGNEPNLFSLVSGLSPAYTVPDYIRDLEAFNALRAAVVPHAQLMGPGSYYDNAGSETPYGRPFGPLASQILPAAPRIYNLLTFHEYPATSTRCPGVGNPVPVDPLAPDYLDGVLRTYDSLDALGRKYDPGRPIWYGEAGSASCGGQQGYSNRFEATFWYLNALGALAQRGLQVFIRQTLSGSDYGLIDDATLQPNPDYWAALLWHRLMGTEILRPKLQGAPTRLRVYAACSRGRAAVTLLALNLDRSRSVTVATGAGARSLEFYRVSARAILDRQVLLNGKPLRTGAGGRLPALRPQLTNSRRIVLPPTTYAFIVEPGVGPAACR